MKILKRILLGLVGVLVGLIALSLLANSFDQEMNPELSAVLSRPIQVTDAGVRAFHIALALGEEDSEKKGREWAADLGRLGRDPIAIKAGQFVMESRKKRRENSDRLNAAVVRDIRAINALGDFTNPLPPVIENSSLGVDAMTLSLDYWKSWSTLSASWPLAERQLDLQNGLRLQNRLLHTPHSLLFQLIALASAQQIIERQADLYRQHPELFKTAFNNTELVEDWKPAEILKGARDTELRIVHGIDIRVLAEGMNDVNGPVPSPWWTSLPTIFFLKNTTFNEMWKHWNKIIDSPETTDEDYFAPAWKHPVNPLGRVLGSMTLPRFGSKSKQMSQRISTIQVLAKAVDEAVAKKDVSLLPVPATTKEEGK